MRRQVKRKVQLKRASDGVYVAPKFAPVHYEEEDNMSSRAKKEEKRKRKNLKSTLMKELRDEYSDKPRELKDHLVEENVSDVEEDNHRRRYEEDNFVRLADKKGKKNKRKMVVNELDGLTDFGDFHHLDDNVREEDVNTVLKKKSVMEHIRKLENSERKRTKLHKGGDEDLPYKGERNTRASRNTDKEDHFGGFEDSSTNAQPVEDEYYQQVKNAKMGKKQQRDEMYKHTDYYLEEEEADGKRGVSKTIGKEQRSHTKEKERNEKS